MVSKKSANKYKQMSFLFNIQSGSHKCHHHIKYEQSLCHLLVLFAIKRSAADGHIYTFTQSHALTETNIKTQKNLLISSHVHIVGPLMVSASVIKPYWLNRCTVLHIHHNHAFQYHTHVLARHTETNMRSWIFTHHRRNSLLKKKPIRSYIEDASLYCLSPSRSLVFLPCFLSCGRQHWAPSHAISICVLVKWFPCFPRVAVAEACSSGRGSKCHRIRQVVLASSYLTEVSMLALPQRQARARPALS